MKLTSGKLRAIFRNLFLISLAMGILVLSPAVGISSDVDTLVVGYHRATNNLLPGATSSLPNIMANLLIYDGLVIHDYQGKVQPLLAKSWEVSDDGLVWIFHLRDDVTFHSGRKFTAKDVKAHFDMWKTSLPTAVKIDALKETTVLDDYTVQFTLSYPTLVFLNMISQTEWSYSGIPDSAAVEKYGKDYGLLPESVSGTGPYILKKWIRNDRMEFERNPDYKWGPKFYDNTGPVRIKKLIIRSIPEEASRSAALERQEIDTDLRLSTKDAPRFRKMKGVSVIVRPKITSNTLGFNHSRPLWKDLKLRKALMYAIDQQALVDVVYNGFAEPMIGIWHEAVEGHTPKDEIAKIAPSYDPEMAKKLLDEAGWKPGPGGIRVKDGEPLRFTVYIYTERQAALLTLVKEMWRSIGADAVIRQLEYAAWRDAMRAGEHDMRYVDGTHSTADLSYWYVCKSIPYPNHLFWCDPKTEKYYEISVKTVKNEERVKAFQDLEKDFMRRAVMIPMPHHMWVVGGWDYVKDMKLHPIHGIYKLMDVYKVPK